MEDMTVGRSSRDAEGDARGSGLSHRQVAAGSRFWVLSSEFEGSDDEIWEVDGAVEGAVGDRSVGSPPLSRTLGDFLGLEQEGGGLAGRTACLRSSSRSSSPARARDPLFSPSDFPPLSGAWSLPRSSWRWVIGPSRCRRRPRHRRSWVLPRRRRQIW
jgi:hypothetical protein